MLMIKISSNRYNNRPENLPHIPVTGATGNIKSMLKEHEKSYDFVIADYCRTRQRRNEKWFDGGRRIHFPLRPSQMDLDVVPHTCSVFTAAKDFNEAVRGYHGIEYDAN